jgi:transposase
VPRGSSSQADTDHGRPHPRRTTAWPCWQSSSTAPVGVDTHRDTLTAAAVTHLGGVLAQTTTDADAAGDQRLLDFAHAHLPGRGCWAVEGTGSFGAGLAGFGQQHGERVARVGRPKRPASRTGAKSDALDAVRAAHQALGQDHLAAPRRRGERQGPCACC